MPTEHQQSNNGLASAETMDTITWVDRQLDSMKFARNKEERTQKEIDSRNEDTEKMKIMESRLSSTNE